MREKDLFWLMTQRVIVHHDKKAEQSELVCGGLGQLLAHSPAGGEREQARTKGSITFKAWP